MVSRKVRRLAGFAGLLLAVMLVMRHVLAKDETGGGTPEGDNNVHRFPWLCGDGEWEKQE